MPPSAVEEILNRAKKLSSEERKALAAALIVSDTGTTSLRRSAYGKYAGKMTPVDEFLRIKHEEADRDDQGPAQ